MIFLSPPSSYQNNTRIFQLTSGGHTKISATYLSNNQAKYTILYAHGNSEDLGNIRHILEELHGWGFSVFAYDYRGYGTSEGTPTEKGAYEDIDTAYNYLTRNLKITSQKIIVLGRSVGGGSAVNLAMHKPVDSLIIESSLNNDFLRLCVFA